MRCRRVGAMAPWFLNTMSWDVWGRLGIFSGRQKISARVYVCALPVLVARKCSMGDMKWIGGNDIDTLLMSSSQDLATVHRNRMVR